MKFLIFSLLPILVFSYEWSPPQIVGTGRYSRLALDCYNRLWCLYTYDSLYGSFYENSQWSEPVSIFSGPSISCVGGFDATRARDGKLWVLVCEEAFPEYYNTLYYDGNIWSDTFIIAGFTNHHLTADSIGKVWVVFDGNEDWRIWCDIGEDTIWTGPYVVCTYPTHEQVAGSKITVDPYGFRWVGAMALLYPSGERIFLCNSDSTGAWSDSLILVPQVTNGILEDLISDNFGNIWIAWFDWFENKIYTAYLDTNLNWSPYYQITQFTGEFGWCNLAVDDENKVWIVYDKNNNFYYRVWDGFEWSPEDSIVPPPASSALHSAIFYDPIRDRIWVSFKTDGNTIYTTWTKPSSELEEQRLTLDAKRLSLEIYPNPAKGVIHVRVPKSVKEMRIYDISGRVVKTFSERFLASLGMTGEVDEFVWTRTDVSGKKLPAGVYICCLKTIEGATVTKQIIIMK